MLVRIFGTGSVAQSYCWFVAWIFCSKNCVLLSWWHESMNVRVFYWQMCWWLCVLEVQLSETAGSNSSSQSVLMGEQDEGWQMHPVAGGVSCCPKSLPFDKPIWRRIFAIEHPTIRIFIGMSQWKIMDFHCWVWLPKSIYPLKTNEYPLKIDAWVQWLISFQMAPFQGMSFLSKVSWSLEPCYCAPQWSRSTRTTAHWTACFGRRRRGFLERGDLEWFIFWNSHIRNKVPFANHHFQ